MNVPFMAHAGAEDPMVWSASYLQVYRNNVVSGNHAAGNNTAGAGLGPTRVFHAVLHDEQITRCADAPVGCWPGGRHAFSTDHGASWDYSAFDAYNGTVEYTDGTTEQYYLRARPHLLIDEPSGRIIALSTGLRPAKESEYVFTLVQPVISA